MVNVVILQGAIVPGTDSVFYLQINGNKFEGARDVEVHMAGDVASYVKTVIQSGLLCVLKGRYVPDGNYIEAESVSLLKDLLERGESMWA
jgi:hypothetical protein